MKLSNSVIFVFAVLAFICNSALSQDNPSAPVKPDVPNKTPRETEPALAPNSENKAVSNNGSDAVVALKIGVVNIAEVFNRYNKTKDYTKLLELAGRKEQTAIKEIETQIKKINDELDALSKTSDLYRDKQEDLAKLIAQREYKLKNWSEYAKAQWNEQILKIYKDIRDTIDSYAKENNFTFIFKADPSLASSGDSEDAEQRISLRAVLYYPKSADITEEIIRILNRQQ